MNYIQFTLLQRVCNRLSDVFFILEDKLDDDQAEKISQAGVKAAIKNNLIDLDNISTTPQTQSSAMEMTQPKAA